MSANAASPSASLRPADSASGALSWSGYARIGRSRLARPFWQMLCFLPWAGLRAVRPGVLPLGNVSAPIIIFTVVPAVAAAVLYASLLQSVRKRAAPMFTVIAAITCVVTVCDVIKPMT